MRNTLLLFLLVNIIFLIRCTEDKQHKTGNIKLHQDYYKEFKIDPEFKTEKSILDFYSNIQLVQLETNPECIINVVDKIIFFQNTFFVLDRKQKAVLAFSDSGRFLFKINNPGRGPQEYSLLYDIELNRYTNNIELLDPRGKLLEFDVKGNFIKTYKIPLPSCQRFICLNKDTILFYSKYEKFKLNLFSRKTGKIVGSFYTYPDIINNTPLIPDGSPFQYYNCEVLFAPGFSGEVYTVKGNSLINRYKWNLGKYNFDLKDLPANKDLFYYPQFLRNSGKAYCFLFNLETDSFIYTKIMFRNRWHMIIYYKDKADYFIFNKFKEDLLPPPKPVLFEKGIMSSVMPEDLHLLVRPEILDSCGQKVYKNAKPDGNPVIIKYYF